MKYFDISPKINSDLAVFPGDTPFKLHNDLSFDKGHNLVLSHFETTCHLGSHADAPIHYNPKGE